MRDETRVVEALPTIRHAVSRKARVVLASHLGKAKGARDPKYSLQPVAGVLDEDPDVVRVRLRLPVEGEARRVRSAPVERLAHVDQDLADGLGRVAALGEVAGDSAHRCRARL